VGNDLTLADLYGVCGLAPVMALLPFDFPKVEDWLLGVVAPTLMDRRLAVYIIYVYVYIYIYYTHILYSISKICG